MMIPVPFAAQIVWALAPSGALIAGVGNDYSFDITTPDGPVTRVVMDQEPIVIGGRERDWHIEQVTARMRGGDPEWMWTGPDMATVKPAFDQLLPDHSGRVWVGRSGPGIENPECEKDIETGLWGSGLLDEFALVRRLRPRRFLPGPGRGAGRIPSRRAVMDQGRCGPDRVGGRVGCDYGQEVSVGGS